MKQTLELKLSFKDGETGVPREVKRLESVSETMMVELEGNPKWSMPFSFLPTAG